ncbi:MAG: flagellar basal body-associated FliL family protein [Gammaproteobacteria bacterium]|nr:flagellar basal body-associated FliL family protein [Gammaproteobacteria bacterium]
MADEDLDLDVKEGSKTNTILLIVLIVLLLLVGGGGAAFFLMGDKEGESAGPDTAEGSAEKIEAKVVSYYELSPEFVVNLEDNREVNFMQLKVQLMARDEKVWPVVEHHMPVIRNNIMLLLSSQKYEDMNTREGKEKLQELMRESIQEVIASESPDLKIETVYFTELVMQ